MSGSDQAAGAHYQVVSGDGGDATSATVTFSGEIDLSNVDRVMAPLRAASLDGVTRVVVDLGAVTFFDSSAIRGLLTAERDLESTGIQLSVGPMSGQVRRVLEIAGVLSRLERDGQG